MKEALNKGRIGKRGTEGHNIIISSSIKDYFWKKKIKDIINRGFPNVLEFTIADLFKFILVLLITVTICLFLFNEIIDWKLKQELLLHPCELCNEIMLRSYLNPINITIIP